MNPVSMAAYGPRARHRVQRRDDRVRGLPRVVLDLHEPEHVGVDLGQRGDDLRPADAPAPTSESAPRQSSVPDGAARPDAVGRRRVDGVERVEDVEGGDLHVAADVVGRVGRGVGRRERVVVTGDRPDPPRPEAPVQYAGETGDRVAAAEPVVEGEAAGRVRVRLVRAVDDGVVLVVVVVVEEDPAGRQVGEVRVVAGDAGRVQRG